MKKPLALFLVLLFSVINVNLISFADEIVELVVTYNSSNLFIYVEPPPETSIVLAELTITGIRHGGRALTLSLDNIYGFVTVNKVNEPTCFVIQITGKITNLVGAPDDCDGNIQYSSRIDPLNTPWIDGVNALALNEITIFNADCNLSDIPCSIEYPLTVTPTENPTDIPILIIPPTVEVPVGTPEVTPPPDNMIFIEGFDIYIDAEMASYLTWLQTIPKIVEDSWHQRVRDNEVDDLGNQYGTLLIGSPVVFSNGTPLVDYNLNWFVADVICQLQGKRLPEIEELEAALTEDGFDVHPEYIEWTSTPRIREDDPDKPYFYEIWIKSEEAIDRYSDWLVVDDSRFYYRVYESLQTVDIGFRCALEKLS